MVSAAGVRCAYNIIILRCLISCADLTPSHSLPSCMAAADLRIEWQVWIRYCVWLSCSRCNAHTFHRSPPTLLPSPQPAVYKFTNPVQHSGFEGFTVRFNWCVVFILQKK